MDKTKKIKTEYKIPLSSKSNSKIIFNGLFNNNNDFNPFIKSKNFKLNPESKDKNEKYKPTIDRKKLSSTPPLKRFNLDRFQNNYYNSNKQIESHYFNKRNWQLFSTNPLNKKNAFYKKLKIQIFQKNFCNKRKSVNLNLYKNITASFLKQTKLNDLPITYPFYASFDHKYNSISQRERYKKNLDKLIKVKTILSANKDEHEKIITEFMVKNGVNEIKYLNSENIQKLENYLKTPFKSIPDLTMQQLIKNIINNKLNNTTKNSETKKFKLNNYFEKKSDYNKNKKLRNRSVENHKKNEINDLKKSSSFSNINLALYKDDSRIVQLGKKYSYLLDNNKLVSKLENELKTIKMDKINKLENQNKFNDNKIFVPNLCLSSYGFSEIYKNNIIKYNKKLNNIMKRNEKIKCINRRMYYDSKKNKNLKALELSDIRKYHKITELAVLSKRKQEMINKKIQEINYDNFKNAILLNKFK